MSSYPQGGNHANVAQTPGEDEDDLDEDNCAVAQYQPAAVLDCLWQARNFERDFHMRTEPPFPHEAVAQAPDLAARRHIAKRRNSRLKRAMIRS